MVPVARLSVQTGASQSVAVERKGWGGQEYRVPSSEANKTVADFCLAKRDGQDVLPRISETRVIGRPNESHQTKR